MKISALSFAALFVNAAFSVTQVVSEGWPVAYEESNFVDGMADEVGGRVDGRMNVSVRSEEQVGGGVGAGKLSSASTAHAAAFQEKPLDDNSSNDGTGGIVLGETADNKQVEEEKEELRKKNSELLAQNLELKQLLASALQLHEDQNIRRPHGLEKDGLDSGRMLRPKNLKATEQPRKKKKAKGSDEEKVCGFKPTVEVVTHAIDRTDDIFWSTWKEGAENALNDTAYLKWNAVGYEATAAAEALEKACSSSDAVVVTVPYASGTEDYDIMDDAINGCIFDHAKPVFTTNTDTYHNDDVYAYFGSSNYDMGVKCALAVLFPDDVDIISGRKSLPETTDHSMDIRIYWDAVSEKDEGLRQRLQGLKTTFDRFGKEVVEFLPAGRPTCPCVSQYPEGVPTDDDGLRMTIDGQVYQYPAGYGLETCARHDKNMIPSCSGENPPPFCDRTWCYVDPDNCDSVEPSTEGQYIWTDYPGQEYPYSYETCGSKNLYVDFIDEDSGVDEESDGGGLTGDNIQTIVLSSNWAPDFEADDRPESVFICGDETYSMPHVPQLGQSPFLQGLSASAAAATAARGVEENREWRAFVGNAASSTSSSTYNGPGSYGSFDICLRDRSDNSPVSKARVQCWDNDNNGFGQEIGSADLTDDSGCHRFHYDANKSWDWAWGNAARPDIYCIVEYNGGRWRTSERTNHDGTFFVQTLTETIPPPRKVKVCVASTTFNNEPVSGAHVQCWDNDNNGLGSPVGEKGMTGDDGCCIVQYDPSTVGDPWQFYGRDPDIYCTVKYLGEEGEEWKTNQNEGINLVDTFKEFSTVRVPTTFRSKIKESLSRHGKSIVETFERYNVEVGSTWDVFGDAEFEDDWIIQHPPQQYFGNSSRFLPLPEKCTNPKDEKCNTEFGLKICETDADCIARKLCPGPGESLYDCTDAEKTEPFAKGVCREVDATKQSVNGSTQKLCVGHSDFLYDRMFNHIIEAEEFVDVTSLDSPNIVGQPLGVGTRQFGAMFRNAIRYLDSKEKSIVIKFHFGSVFKSNENPKKILEDFLEGVSLSSRITIMAGTYRTGFASWNHGKTITIDGKKVITGGTNYYPTDYLDQDPVFDVNIRVSNGPAMGAHNYAARLWRPTCEWTFAGTGGSHVEAAIYENGEVVYATGDYITTGLWECPPVFKSTSNPYEKSGNGAMVIQAARLGELASDEGGNNIEHGRMTSDLAMLAMMESAQNSIKFSQQDMLPLISADLLALTSAYGGFDCGAVVGCSGMTKVTFDDTWRKIGGIAKALSRGISVYVMVSAPCAFAAGDPNDPNGNLSGNTKECPVDGSQGNGFDYWGDVLAANGGDWPSPRPMDRADNHITGSMSPLGGVDAQRRLSYGYGWSLYNIADWIYAYYAINKEYRPTNDDNGNFKTETEVVDHICEFLNIAHVRLTAEEDTYIRGLKDGEPIPGGQIGNHAKVVIADDEAFYIGSDNAYASGLAEFGLIVDDAARASEFVNTYWTNLWTQAIGTKENPGLVSGADGKKPDEDFNCPWKSYHESKSGWEFNY